MEKQHVNKWVRTLVFASPFVFPLYLLRFSIYGIPFTALEVFTYILFAIWLFGIVKQKYPLIWEKPLSDYWLAGFLLLIGATLGAVTAPHGIPLPDGTVLDAQRAALGVWKGWVVAPMLYFAVLTQTLKSKADAEKLARLFIYSAALVVVIAFGLGIFADGFTYDNRLSGFFESANYLSLYLVPALLLSIYFLFHKSKGNRFLNITSFILMAIALYMTQSYAAILAVFGSLVLYFLHFLISSRMGWKKVAKGLIAIVAIFVVVLLTQINTPKFKQFLDYENRSSTSVRLEIYEVTWHLMNQKPFTGVGPGLFQANYQTAAPVVLGQAPMEWNMPHPHNIFFAFWLNAGILGFLALLLILFYVHKSFTYPLIAFWGIILHGFFDTPFWKNDLAMIFWLVLALIIVLQTHGTTSDKKPAD